MAEDEGMARFIPVEELCAGRHFDTEIVVLFVRWYLSFKLSYRDLVRMMSEPGIVLAHTTILRWVQHNTPEFECGRTEPAAVLLTTNLSFFEWIQGNSSFV
ncbi:MAG: hypothetical protein WKF37_08365 [Bryobacteraceae bacterium]